MSRLEGLLVSTEHIKFSNMTLSLRFQSTCWRSNPVVCVFFIVDRGWWRFTTTAVLYRHYCLLDFRL